MTATELLAEARRRGIALAPKGEKLRVDAPVGALTPELRQALTEHKTDILAHLRRQSSPRLIDHLADPVAFGAWLERLMERDS